MSLKAVHVFVISLSACLLLFFGVWAMPRMAAWGIVSLVAGAALVPYVLWFFRKVRSSQALVENLWLATGRPAFWLACSVCFGDPDSAMTKSILWGVAFLLGVVSFVLGFIAFTAWTWSRHARRESQ